MRDILSESCFVRVEQALNHEAVNLIASQIARRDATTGIIRITVGGNRLFQAMHEVGDRKFNQGCVRFS